MKPFNHFRKYFLALLVLLTPLTITHADIIMPGTHPVERCVRITNINNFSDLRFLGFIQGPVVDYESDYKMEIPYEIEENECLHKGYKHNSLSVYSISAEDFNLENLEILSEGKEDLSYPGRYYDYFYPEGFQFISEIPAGSTYADDKTAPHVKEILDYELVKDANGVLNLYKAKHTYEYADDTPTRTDFFPHPTHKLITIDEVIPFPDTEPESDEAIAAENMQKRNIIQGFPDGEFKGDRPVNRAELAKMLILAKRLQIEEQKNNGRFTDIEDGAWYEKYVIKAAELGIINGHPDGSFRPETTVNTAEFLKMVAHAFELHTGADNCLDDYTNSVCNYKDVPEDAWFAKYAGIRRVKGFFPKRDFYSLEPAREMTRNEVVVALDKLF